MLISVRLCGFVGMHSRLALVTCSGVSVMSGLLVLASLMLFGSLIMMLGGFAAVDRCLFMVFRSFLGHGGIPLLGYARPAGLIVLEPWPRGFVPSQIAAMTVAKVFICSQAARVS